jgi:Asp/Glu/hydantoin racemase
VTKLAVIHTTTATVEPLKALAAEALPGCTVVNFVDDSILPQLAANGGNLADVAGRVIQYARYAEDIGADAILEACSSIGEVVQLARQQLRIPIVRIDDAMAERAVARARQVGVAATLATTLAPTVRLIEAKAAEAGREVEVESLLVADAYRKLMAGDREGHDEALVAALTNLAPRVDVVVLAQASMARVLPRLPQALQDRCLTSPPLAMDRVRQVLAGQGTHIRE